MIKPMPHHIVLGAPVTVTKTEGGIHLPEAEVQRQATVLAVGANVKAVKPGDQVIYRPYAGEQVTYKDEKYLIVQEKELRAIVNTNQAA